MKSASGRMSISFTFSNVFEISIKSKQKFKEEALSKIENLDSDESDHEYVKRPPAGVRNGAGGYELTEDFGKLCFA